jgi:hypothetical protein
MKKLVVLIAISGLFLTATGATAATTHAPHPRMAVYHAQYISMAKKKRRSIMPVTVLI